MKILIATDGEACSQAALNTAIPLIAEGRHEVTVVTVIPPLGAMMPPFGVGEGALSGEVLDELVAQSEQSARSALQEARRALEAQGVEAQYVTLSGDPAEELQSYARELQPELLILGSHGRSALGRLFLGSVSEALLHRYNGPILVARQAPGARPCAPSPQRALRVSEVMTSDVLCAEAQTSLQQAAQMMITCEAGILPVVEGGKLIGVITDRDIVARAIARGVIPARGCVGEFMSSQVETTSPETSVDEAIKHMEARGIRRLPVVEQGRLVGIVSLGDLAEWAPIAAEEVLVEISKSPKTLAHGHEKVK